MMPIVLGVVNTADWRAVPEDIRQVCLSVTRCFEAAISDAYVEPIRIEPSYFEPPHPRTTFDRLETGQVRVMLSARETLWPKYAYQFAHEFCHVLCNLRWTRDAHVRWIEES